MTSSANPSAAESIARFSGRIAELREQTQAAQAALASVTATAQSPDGLVRATVDSSGALVGIDFGAIDGTDPAALSRAVLSTVSRARIEVLDAARERVVERVGADNPAVAVLADRAADLRASTSITDDASSAAPARLVPETDGADEPSAADTDHTDDADNTDDTAFSGRGE